MAGEYTAEVMLAGLTKFIQGAVPKGVDLGRVGIVHERAKATKARAREILGGALPKRPPGFCVGCPERPVFSAMRLLEREVGKVHVAADIGCHTFSTLPPFNIGNSILGYGLGLASTPGVAHSLDKRVISVVGDGGFWHNGLTTGVGGAVHNEADSVLLIMNNGYTAATGQQILPSSRTARWGVKVSIQRALTSMGVTRVKTVRSYSVGKMVRSLREAMTTPTRGLKVIVAEGECQLARQRRLRPARRDKLAAGQRVTISKFGVDADVCTGDHSCIRLSGCPSLTIKDNPDPLRQDPVAHVDNECVGCGVCGVCGEVAEAVALCPSFYRADFVHNPGRGELMVERARRAIIAFLQRISERRLRRLYAPSN